MKQNRLLSNIFALGSVQLLGNFVSLLTLPYLARVFGSEAFGRYSLVQLLMTYLALIIEYGFLWHGTRLVASLRGDRAALSEAFSSIWGAQWLLAAVAGLILAGMVRFMPLLQDKAGLCLIGFTFVIGYLLTPHWLYQGLEHMRPIAVIEAIGRVAGVPLLFILVKQPGDVGIALGVFGSGQLLSGFLALWWMRRRGMIEWQYPRLRPVLGALRAGGGYFFSKLSVHLYGILIPLVLGSLSGTVAVGYFNLANKARMVAQSLLQPLSQALFPRMSHLYLNDRLAADRLLRRSMLLVLALALPLCLLIWFNASLIVTMLGGSEFAPAAGIMRWLAFIPLLFAFSDIFGVQVMIPNSLGRHFNLIVALVTGGGLLFINPFIAWNGPYGAAMLMFLVELLMVSALGSWVLRNGFLKRRPPGLSCGREGGS